MYPRFRLSPLISLCRTSKDGGRELEVAVVSDDARTDEERPAWKLASRLRGGERQRGPFLHPSAHKID